MSGQGNRKQSGIALFVALIFLVVLTVLGVTAMNGNTLQTRLAAGAGQSNFAFQAAEIGLRSGEDWLASLSEPPPATCGSPCADPAAVFPRYGLATPVVTAANLVDDAWFAANGRRFSSELTLSDPSSPGLELGTDQPRYVIEYLGADPGGSLLVAAGTSYRIHYYLVTGHGVAGLVGIDAVTQSVYAKGF